MDNNRSSHSEVSVSVSVQSQARRKQSSSLSSSSGDKKPRAKETTNVVERHKNPFHASTMRERDENFPSFEQAMLLNQSSVSCQSNNSSNSNSIACNLSISARAALNEHNRHIALYGIDDSMQHLQQHQQHYYDDHLLGTARSTDPLDAEWERLLLNTSYTSNVNLSRISSNLSAHSIAHSQSVTSTNPRAKNIPAALHASMEGEEAIEVMTDISISDYFNTSRVLQLRTPEHLLRYAQNPQHPTTRAEGDAQQQQQHQRQQHVFPLHNDTSASSASEDTTTSSSNESARMMRRLFLNAGLPPLEFSSPRSQQTWADRSVSLNNVDLSRISNADDASEFAALGQNNVDFSFTNNNNNNVSLNHSICSVSDHLITIDEVPPPVTDSGNKKKKMIEQQQQQKQKQLPYMMGVHSSSPNRGPRLTPRNRSPPNIHNSSSSGSLQQRQQLAASPIRFKKSPTSAGSWMSPLRPPRTPNRGSPRARSSPSSSSSGNKPGNFEILDLSPISIAIPDVRARRNDDEENDEEHDAALAMLGLSPISKQAADSAISILQTTDWKVAAIKKKNYQASSHRNPFAEDTEQLGALNSIHDNITNNSSSIESQSNQLCSIVEYDSRRHDGTDDISPLHSSSEQKKSASSNSGLAETNPFETSDLKKSSLSSISPNSSSEHHVTTKQTSSSSLSRSSMQQRKPSHLSVVQSSSASALSWGATDRRRYRTVVPARVFLAEPSDFPNEDDSFSIPFNDNRRMQRTVVPGRVPVDMDYDSFSAPARQQHAVPIERRRIGERSIMSSPR